MHGLVSMGGHGEKKRPVICVHGERSAAGGSVGERREGDMHCMSDNKISKKGPCICHLGKECCQNGAQQVSALQRAGTPQPFTSQKPVGSRFVSTTIIGWHMACVPSPDLCTLSRHVLLLNPPFNVASIEATLRLSATACTKTLNTSQTETAPV